MALRFAVALECRTDELLQSKASGERDGEAASLKMHAALEQIESLPRRLSSPAALPTTDQLAQLAPLTPSSPSRLSCSLEHEKKTFFS